MRQRGAVILASPALHLQGTPVAGANKKKKKNKSTQKLDTEVFAMI
jgi:hypothetical protein